MSETEQPRANPRVKKALPVEIRFADGDAVHASASDVSAAGLQINCEPAIAHTVAPPDAAPPALRAVLRVPGPGGEPVTVSAACRPVFCRRITDEEYRVGFALGEFDGDDRASLERFLDGELAD